ncbi:hypothetical protein EDB89DRAFT_1977135 [Lactarius sanguifluus]|nr:hypothetical protein EDB89DRAFT_1977135 [Lactarius sanguifluus]
MSAPTSLPPDVFVLSRLVVLYLHVFISTSSSCLVLASFFCALTHYATHIYLEACCFLPNGAIVFLSIRSTW